MKGRLQFFVVLFSLVAGVAATLWGFSNTPVIFPSTLTWDLIPQYAIWFAIALVLVELCGRLASLNRLFTGVVLIALVCLVTSNIWPLIVTTWFFIASFVVGRAVIALLKLKVKRVSDVTAVLVGVAIYGTATGFAAHFPVNYPGLYGLALVAPIVFGWRSAYVFFLPLLKMQIESSHFKRHDSIIAAVGLVHVAVALMPEVGHDALATHLFVPAQLAARHQWGFDVTTYAWAVMPMLGDWIFSVGYMLAGEPAARLINVSFIFILAWLVRDLVEWAGGTTLGARWAALIFLTTPLTFTESSSLFIESIWTSLVIAGSLLVLKILQRSRDEIGQLPLGALLLGAALATKAVTLTNLPSLLLIVLIGVKTWKDYPQVFQIVRFSVALFLAVGIIPYVYALHVTGNPVFPFFNNIFLSPFFSPNGFEPPAIFSKGLTWDVLYQATFRTEKFLESRPGGSGFQWLLLLAPTSLILYFNRQNKGLALIILAGLSTALTFHSTAYLRYIFPSFALGTAAICVGLFSNQSTNFLTKIISQFIASVVVFLNFFFFASATNYSNLSLEPLLSTVGRDSYLATHLPIRIAVDFVNTLNRENRPVAVFADPLTAGLKGDALYPNWYNEKFYSDIKTAVSEYDLAEVLMNRDVGSVILDERWGVVQKRKIVEQATEKIALFESISVRRLKPSYQFQTEMLRNTRFSPNSADYWIKAPGIYEDSTGGFISTVRLNASQGVPVLSGRRYRNTVIAVCKDRSTEGRVQVNWLDAKSDFIKADIQVFTCLFAESTHVMEVKAPPNASVAFVYATGHTDQPIIFREVSFKK